MSPMLEKLQALDARIVAAVEAAGRPRDAVQFIAVSKTHPVETLREAVAAGVHTFGENYLQEALDKIAALGPGICWHFIGPIQSNKTRPVAEHFDWVQSVDRLKIAERLSAQRPPEKGPLNVCLQVNISGEETKSGVTPAELPALAQAVARLPQLRLRGLMAIPAPTTDVAQQHADFARLRALYEQLQRDGLALDTLSMGMSADMEAAIAEGATLIRIGTALFGARDYSQKAPA
ncbi:YggS family pyridoxal phosphate-dependent enzyme [Massilia sp. TS11]|uniref:YggS family pyridoxal phosphate-dependent enzyme n=1 Tax=Massilia sp. TS11 TaxID=2908003 RepID=UPI001EDA923E|nr:YggS family pyridoxal phosphate-dependent enzyme [Massilia sp. TS11]MCG2585378.1 YggS family pyridoxal phosphate-dependent enzyme [Massilia sp. TS11]